MAASINRLEVANIIASNAALTPSSGDKLFGAIYESLQQPASTEVNFQSIQYLTSAFLNAAIGQLYAHYDSGFLRANLSITNLQQDDAVLLAKVIERAKEYFHEKESFNVAMAHVLND